MRNRFVILVLVSFFCTGCGVLNDVVARQKEKEARQQAEEGLRIMAQEKEAKNSYGYHPIDPLPVEIRTATGAPLKNNIPILDALPDETMRMAIGTVSNGGGISFGPAKIGMQNQNYVVILDYIKFDTNSVTIPGQITGENDQTLPVYVGVGLRLTANILVNVAGVDLANLFAVSAAVDSKQVTGTLVVQTLGISGEGVSSIIPIPSEINPTTIQNALMALGAIKSKIYDSRTRISPRVVGISNTVSGGAERLVRTIPILLAKRPYITVRNELPPDVNSR